MQPGYLSRQGITRAAVVDHVIGPGQPVGAGQLGGHDSDNLFRRQTAALPDPLDLQEQGADGSGDGRGHQEAEQDCHDQQGQTGQGHFPADVDQQVEDVARQGATPLVVAEGKHVLGVISLKDIVKGGIKERFAQLRKMGIKTVMITGDNRHTAEAIARQLNIDTVIAEVLPEEKVQAVQQLQKQYGCTAFVGDGINDAPALAQADVGLAIGTGTDIAMEAADVVLMSGNLQGVPNAIALSKATIGNIRQNLFWAFGYNTALIPVAAGVLYPAYGVLLSPIFAAGAMALSSVFVLGNALRLRRFQPPLAADTAH